MSRKIATGLILCLLMADYFLGGLLGIQAHTDPAEMDTTAYLSAACQIQETGGVFHHLQNCVNGVYREATQHPLYLLVLSGFAHRDVHFFVNAKIATFIIGFLLLLVFFFTVWNIFGVITALLGLCFLVSSATFLNLSTMVACETLLAVFFLLFWFFAAKGFEKPRFWLAAGFFAALAFLTKSLAILILPAFFLAAFILSQKRKINFFKNKYFYGFFAVFFIISSPLLARNIKVFHTPFYSDSSAVLWIDRWHDYYRSDIKENPPTLSSYLKSHTPSQIAATFFTGLFVRDPKMIADGLKPFAFWESKIELKKLQGFYEKSVPWQGIWAAFLFLLAALGLWKSREKPSAVIAAASLLLFLVFVAWYSKVFPGNPPTRLLYPVLFFIYLFAAKVLSEFFQERWSLGLAGIFAVLYIFSIGFHFDWRKLDIQKSYAFTNPFVAELHWVDSHLAPGQKLMAGVVFTSYLFYFESKIKGEVLQWPQVESLDELQVFIRDHAIRYGILDLSTVVYDLKPYRKYYEVGPRIGLHPIGELPPPFHRIFRDPNAPTLYEIYEFSDSR